MCMHQYYEITEGFSKDEVLLAKKKKRFEEIGALHPPPCLLFIMCTNAKVVDEKVLKGQGPRKFASEYYCIPLHCYLCTFPPPFKRNCFEMNLKHSFRFKCV